MELVNESLQSLVYVVLGILVFFIGKFVKDIITPFNDDKELTTNDNPALGLSVCGYYLGIIIIYMGACLGPSLAPGAFIDDKQFWGAVFKQAGVTAIWSLVGIFALNAARYILDKLTLKNFSVEKEIIKDRNVGAGAVEFGSYIASALVIAAAIYGDSGSALTALAFFVIGQAAMVIFTMFYNKVLTPYCVHEHIEQNNNAAGVALAGNFIAIGLVVAGCSSEVFVDWGSAIANFGIHFILGIIFLVVGRFVADKLLLPGSCLNKEISEDKNVGAALVESAAVITFGVLIFALV